ncbi:sigma-70 family RNA polymerase sigma factor [Marinihelvus fidelis]|uniref:Sigma-70 family RNA polymerase sigma factor n=1 Tax=Marinihelvus fidelis TaxID=2613842 RepID=A0A5N0TLK3_9GAMM|nr:sigma-70 family RNA polymerase sigma factor [Marinihelvus fidelis]KAA9134209.1 sigma-70 family RNA polymerase sigma factor [Marinihelvus fidelis]
MRAQTDDSGAPSESAFHQAIARRGDYWYSACLRITRNPELAGDAVQDALLNAWRKRSQFAGEAQLDTWIHRIAVNSALSLVRARHPERWQAMETDSCDDQPTPDVAHHYDELDTSLQSALRGLSEMERVCFILKHLEQWTLQEIATELTTSLGTVKQALFRAVKKLRVTMSGLRSAS